MTIPVDHWRRFALAAALALVTTGVSMNIGERREHRAETVGLQEAILRGEPGTLDGRPIYFPQFQNRVLFPIAHAVTVRVTGLDPLRAYVVLRILSTWLAFLIVLYAAESVSGSPARATETAVLLALAMIVTFNHPWEHSTDMLDMAVFALAVPWTLDRRYGRMVALAIVASANRESSVFLSLLWGAVQGARTGPSRRVLVETTGLALVAAGTVTSLRWGFGGAKAVAGPDIPLGETLAAIRAFLSHPSPHDWPIGLAVLFVLCAAALWHRPLTREQSAIVGAGVVIAALSAVGGAAEELRIYVPTITMIIMAGAQALARRLRSALTG